MTLFLSGLVIGVVVGAAALFAWLDILMEGTSDEW